MKHCPPQNGTGLRFTVLVSGLTRVAPGQIGTRTGLAPSGGRRDGVLLPVPVSRSLGGGFPRGGAAPHVSCSRSQAPAHLPTRPRPDPRWGTAGKPERTRLTTPGSGTRRSWGSRSGPIGHRCRLHPGDPRAAQALRARWRRDGQGACALHEETRGRRAEDARLLSIPPPHGQRRPPRPLHTRLVRQPTRDRSPANQVLASVPSVSGGLSWYPETRPPWGPPEQPERRKGGDGVENRGPQ